ncbi:glycosyltransferase family 2 protein [Sulfurimonas sp.]|uniref:glycosyltransferase family 2 protein n=1 Tax=Sulfurimonas sp. TaxID=2022749 RepID=UPI0019F9567B|nr:glycosyltransferase family 2 protein [Sulfurimonas sp.]MBE0515689.1 glycosyltransferase family 2 protein [Sulfurimonas sp.]
MKTSLIVTTYNWPEALEFCVKSALAQTYLPSEIIIADDGSSAQTKDLVEILAKTSPIKIIHSWQEDLGFRLARSRNLAIAKASSEYIVIVDGDMILDTHFLEDHLDCATKGFYIQGSRAILGDVLSKQILKNKQIPQFSFFNKHIKNKLNMLRISLLRKYICSKSSQSLHAVRGCNFAFFREDILKVNGFNEDFTTWGREDSEFIQRLYHIGIQRKRVKFGAIQFHIYHKESSSNNHNDTLLENTIQNKLTWCDNGINKHLKDI